MGNPPRARSPKRYIFNRVSHRREARFYYRLARLFSKRSEIIVLARLLFSLSLLLFTFTNIFNKFKKYTFSTCEEEVVIWEMTIVKKRQTTLYVSGIRSPRFHIFERYL